MHVIFFLPSHENCGCYGNGNSQILAKTYGSRDNSLTIQTSFVHRWQCVDYVRHFFSLSHKNCGCYGNRNSQNVAPVGDLCVAGNTCGCLLRQGFN